MDNLPPYAAPPRIWVTFFSTYEGESDLLISQQRGDVFTAAREYEATIEAEFRVTNCGNFDETDYDAKYYRKDVLNHAIDYALNRNAELVIATHDRLTWSELYAISDATAKRYLCVRILDLQGGDYSNPIYLGFTVGVASSQVKCPNRRPAAKGRTADPRRTGRNGQSNPTASPRHCARRRPRYLQEPGG